MIKCSLLEREKCRKLYVSFCKVVRFVFAIILVSYYFGRIPLIGIILNPLLILTANATVLLSLLWIIAPLPLLQGPFSAAIGAAAGLQNAVVGLAAEKSWASFPLRLEAWQVIALYAAVLAACLLLRGRKIKHNEPSLSETI